MRPMAVLCVLLLMGAVPWHVRLGERAIYLLQVENLTRVGFDMTGLRLGRVDCWKHARGVVCDACYDDLEPPARLAHASAVCSWRDGLCQYVLTAADIELYGVDLNHCVKGTP